jgi:transposase
VRPRRPAAWLTLALAPGECAQVAWGAWGAGPVGPPPRQRSFLGLGLGESRRLSVACTVSQTMEPCWACHQPALAFLGGRPPTGRVDTRKSAVLQRAVGDAPGLNPTYLDLATPPGFPRAPGHIGKGHEKGRVDNGVGYGNKPGRAGRALPECSARTPAPRHGLDTVAQVRLHGETRQHPSVLGQTERPAWRPVPRPPGARATVSQGCASRPWRLPVEPTR